MSSCKKCNSFVDLSRDPDSCSRCWNKPNPLPPNYTINGDPNWFLSQSINKLTEAINKLADSLDKEQHGK